jgi:hypothetical protein
MVNLCFDTLHIVEIRKHGGTTKLLQNATQNDQLTNLDFWVKLLEKIS